MQVERLLGAAVLADAGLAVIVIRARSAVEGAAASVVPNAALLAQRRAGAGLALAAAPDARLVAAARAAVELPAATV